MPGKLTCREALSQRCGLRSGRRWPGLGFFVCEMGCSLLLSCVCTCPCGSVQRCFSSASSRAVTITTPREFTPLLSHQPNTATMARAPRCTEKLEVASCLSSSTSCLGQEKEREAGSISGRVSSHFPATLNFPGGSSNSRGRDFTLGLRRVLPARGAEARWPPTAGTPRPCPPPTPRGRVGRVPPAAPGNP